MHFVYSLTKALAMVSSPAFKVSMLTWSFPVAFPFFIFFSAVSTSHVVTDSSIRSKILSWSWNSLPWLSKSVISQFWPRICVLLTLFKLFDVSIVFRMVSRLYFLMSSFAFFLRVLHISVYSMQSLAVFFTISLRFSLVLLLELII